MFHTVSLSVFILFLNELNVEQFLRLVGSSFHSLAPLNVKDRLPKLFFTLGSTKLFPDEFLVLMLCTSLNFVNFFVMYSGARLFNALNISFALDFATLSGKGVERVLP